MPSSILLIVDMGGHCTSQISNAETSSGQTGNGLQSAATNVQQINNGDINTIIVQDSSEIGKIYINIFPLYTVVPPLSELIGP